MVEHPIVIMMARVHGARFLEMHRLVITRLQMPLLHVQTEVGFLSTQNVLEFIATTARRPLAKGIAPMERIVKHPVIVQIVQAL